MNTKTRFRFCKCSALMIFVFLTGCAVFRPSPDAEALAERRAWGGGVHEPSGPDNYPWASFLGALFGALAK